MQNPSSFTTKQSGKNNFSAIYNFKKGMNFRAAFAILSILLLMYPTALYMNLYVLEEHALFLCFN